MLWTHRRHGRSRMLTRSLSSNSTPSSRKVKGLLPTNKTGEMTPFLLMTLTTGSTISGARIGFHSRPEVTSKSNLALDAQTTSVRITIEMVAAVSCDPGHGPLLDLNIHREPDIILEASPMVVGVVVVGNAMASRRILGAAESLATGLAWHPFATNPSFLDEQLRVDDPNLYWLLRPESKYEYALLYTPCSVPWRCLVFLL